MNELWEEPKEDDGLTLGPEEALQREIEKSKTLKVDRLRLRDEIEKLKTEKADLTQKNQRLREKVKALENSATSPGKFESSSPNALVFAVVFVFLALLWFMTRN